jgi:hypothetical protein
MAMNRSARTKWSIAVALVGVAALLLLRSGDDSRWSVIHATGLDDEAIGTVTSIAFVDARVGLVAASGASASLPDRLFRSVDGGRTWRSVMTSSGRIGAITCVGARCWTTVDRQLPPTTTTTSALLSSPDAGATWEQVYETVPGQTIGRHSIEPGEGGIGYATLSTQNNAAGAVDLMATNDGGRTWSRLTTLTSVVGGFVRNDTSVVVLSDSSGTVRLGRFDLRTLTTTHHALPERFRPSLIVRDCRDTTVLLIAGRMPDTAGDTVVTINRRRGDDSRVIHIPDSRGLAPTTIVGWGDSLAILMRTAGTFLGTSYRFATSTDGGRAWAYEELPDPLFGQVVSVEGNRIWVRAGRGELQRFEW